jgi:hypothetical protein
MYELLFWKYQDGIYLNHHLVYEALVEQETVEGLEELPVQVILNRIVCIFKMGKVDESSWKNTNGVGAFHINTTPKHSNRLLWNRWETMNLLADTMEEFKCPAYDPQAAL